MPLMSAAKVWSNLEDTVADDSLFKNMTILLLVQVFIQIIWLVCVCTRLENAVLLAVIGRCYCFKVKIFQFFCPHFAPALVRGCVLGERPKTFCLFCPQVV